MTVAAVGFCVKCGRDGVRVSEKVHGRHCLPVRNGALICEELLPAWWRYGARLRAFTGVGGPVARALDQLEAIRRWS